MATRRSVKLELLKEIDKLAQVVYQKRNAAASMALNACKAFRKQDNMIAARLALMAAAEDYAADEVDVVLSRFNTILQEYRESLANITNKNKQSK